MPSKKESKKGKDKSKSQSQIEITKTDEPETKAEEVKPPDYRTITITLEYYQNVAGLFPVSDISTKCTFREDIGESEAIPITDEEKIPINYSASLLVDANNMKELDHLISSPAVLTVTQVQGNFDPMLYEQLVVNQEVLQSPTRSYDSIVSIYEAITGQTVDISAAKRSKGSRKKAEGMKDKAEICLLNMMVQEQKWLEGWVTLHIFYQMTENPSGMDMSLEMAQKYQDEAAPESDYISKIQDLLWSEDFCPKTKFFTAACIYLKLRLYNWVEYALGYETQHHYAIVNYLLAANCYYKKLYPHALEHIQETESYYGIDCNVGSLHGHCLMALERFVEAKDQYHHVLEAYNRPKNIHLVNLNCALAEEKLGYDQEARKFVLLSCKYNPSPSTWLKAGQLYFKQNDLLSAEECFSEANLRDNRNADIWAYLCLVNLRLDRENEAMLCYNQVLRCNLEDKKLLDLLDEEIKSVLQCD
ncbi:unnamed protein product [Acanthoscelides obtectus]|uniref:Tetratricopeptide repeat protein 18 n=1 Tax=Acanthoscelides obtectus TaxID=200917 RepID=A0A9P0PA89_ACAOB|nr:unnamed protein product [Acanthoscelides obtectus]CAK1660554.1 Cilia- and flagella-associated protein 70 [Acanthoscelides obtectus]